MDQQGQSGEMGNGFQQFYEREVYAVFRLPFRVTTQPAFTCSKLIIETLEQGVKYVQS